MSRTRAILENSVSYLTGHAKQAVTLNSFSKVEHPKSFVLASLRNEEELKKLVVGSDQDVGGKSTAHLDIGPHGKGRFWGTLSTELRSGYSRPGVIDRGGYAGFRTRTRPSLFGELTYDIEPYDAVRLRVRNSGDDMAYFVNIQTSSVIRTQIYQHRLFLGSLSDDEWQTVTIPLDDFALTNNGALSATAQEMMKEAVRTIGISVLGPKQGKFELGIEEISVISRVASAAP